MKSVAYCHCLNGDFQFRAETRNPMYASTLWSERVFFLDSGSQPGMTECCRQNGHLVQRQNAADRMGIWCNDRMQPTEWTFDAMTECIRQNGNPM